MRLIDADALINTLNEKKIKFNADVNYFILNAPTVEAEHVVRCKDCKYSKYKQGELRCYIWSISSKTKEDGYCYCGEKMEGVEE